jgi:leader peptidase (prepilin peptidase)/N-methyltransferase
MFGPAVAFVFGLLIGSFLNVCIYRIPRDLSVVFPRSFCPECGGSVHGYDNIPVLSYLLLRGRCRFCGKGIGIRYPLVEITTAVLMAVVVSRYSWSAIALKWAIFECVLVVLFWTDLEERILPSEFTLGGAVVGLVFSWFLPLPADLLGLLLPQISLRWLSVLDASVGAGSFAAVFWVLGALWSRVAGREALGQGDVKLLLMLGTFLGFERELPALTIGAVAGSLAGGLYLLITRKGARAFELPLGSFLCLGAAVTPFLR